MSDDRDHPAEESRRQVRFVSGCGAVVLVIGLVLLIASDDPRSLASSSMLVLLGVSLLLIAPGRSRPRIKKVAVLASLLAIVVAVWSVVLVVS